MRNNNEKKGYTAGFFKCMVIKLVLPSIGRKYRVQSHRLACEDYAKMLIEIQDSLNYACTKFLLHWDGMDFISF